MLKKGKKFLVTLIAILTVILCGLFATACDAVKKKAAPSAVSATSIKYDGTLIDWDDAANATEYVVKITTSAGTTIEYPAFESRFQYPGAKLETVEISITAKNANGASAAVTKLYTRVDPIDQDSIKFDEDGRLSWDLSENAAEYLLEINGKQFTTPLNSWTEFSVGKNTVKIKPINNSLNVYSTWSTAVQMTFLDAPSAIKYDGEILSWKGTDAQKYRVLVDGGNELFAEGGRTSIEYDAGGDNFSVSVQAIGVEGKSISSKLSDVVDFYCLEVVADYNVDLGVLTWEEIEDADGYLVKQNNGSAVEVTKAEWTLPYSGDTANKIMVKPIVSKDKGEAYFSEWSQEWTIRLLEAPTLHWDHQLNLDGDALNALYWDTVEGEVAKYNVTVVDPVIGKYVHNNEKLLSFGHAYGEEGEYKVSVQAVAEPNTEWYSSKPSKEITIIRLGAPNLKTAKIVSNEFSVQSGFTIDWEGVKGEESGYQLYTISGTTKSPMDAYKTSQGVTVLDVRNVVSTDETQMRTFNYGIQTLGFSQMFESGNRVTLASLTENLMEFTITVLPMPANVDIAGGVASWNPVSNSNGYGLSDGETILKNNEYSFLNMTGGAKMDFAVCSIGNGAEILPSNYTPSKEVVRLSAPRNIKIATEVNEGQLSCDPVDYSKSYNVYFNSDKTPVNTAEGMPNVTSKINDYSVSVVMEAVANYYEDEITKSKYYVTSPASTTKQFKQLRAPIFKDPMASENGDTLLWNPPTNALGGWQKKYYIYDKENFAENYVATADQFDLAELPAGAYSYRVKAIGDGDEWINSPLSESAAFTKLAKPVVTKVGNKYTWNAVPMASGYTVKIGNKPVYEVTSTSGKAAYEYAPTFDDIGTYAVEVIANGNNAPKNASLATVDSSPCKIEQVVKALNETTKVTLGYTADRYVSDGKITVAVEPVQNASGYLVRIAGQDHTMNGTSDSYTTGSTGTYKVDVYTLGNVFDEEGTYWIKSTAAATSTITLLQAPSVDSIVFNKNQISWGASETNPKYEVTVTYEDDTTETFENISGTILSAVTFDQFAKVKSVKICAVGNGTTSISSVYVVATRQ
ncbi:MAG: hypothetical protein IJX88_06590 [Clostridia bacterium]|nr:hypothetical protein [Clostridia bacterium]